MRAKFGKPSCKSLQRLSSQITARSPKEVTPIYNSNPQGGSKNPPQIDQFAHLEEPEKGDTSPKFV